MSRAPLPLRYLSLLMCTWVGARILLLTPDWSHVADAASGPAPAEQPAARRGEPGRDMPREMATLLTRARSLPVAFSPLARAGGGFTSVAFTTRPTHLVGGPDPFAAPAIALAGTVASGSALRQPLLATVDQGPPRDLSTLLRPVAPASGRAWSGSAWLFARGGGDGQELAPGGTLGGSQAGLRFNYRLAGGTRRPLAVSARLYAPLERPQGSEAAIGIDWQPLAGVPVHLLAERREAIGREGRSDFALTVYGGGEQRLLADRVRVEAYGQAGVVGLRTRDLFVDGAARATVAVGPVDVGAGVWGGAQPGASRLDIGPHASVRLPVAGTNIRAAAEWRFRVAGDAAPGSGPALTISADF